MNETNVILIHSKTKDPSHVWYPWFVNKMNQNGIKCDIPELPKTNSPILEEWLNEISKLNPNENTILIGHSIGGIAVLRWLQAQ